MQTKLIALKDIEILPNRQRRLFDAEQLMALTETIGSKGLLHAIVLRNGKTLVAGERRTKAIEQLWMLGKTLRYNNEDIPTGFVPFVDLGDLSEIEAEEAELEENLQRVDLTWQESSAATARLHALRQKQAAATGKIHTVADTAAEILGRSDGAYQATMRKEILVAQHLHNPEVQKAKSTEEAFKILKRQEETKKNVELAEKIGKNFSASDHTALNTDCIQWMKEQEPNQFDVILTDPPYGMDAQDFGDGGGKLMNSEHHYDDSLESWRKLMTEWTRLSYRITKEKAHAYVFCDQANFPELKAMMQAAGWYVFRTMLIYHKPNSGRVPLPTMGPRRTYETLLYAIKGNKEVTAILGDMLSHPADANLTHGAQKATALFMDLLKRSCRPGDTVLDTFMGSGTIFPAAHELKLRATGIELNPEYFAIASKRLKEVGNAPAPLDGKALGNELQSMLKGQ